MTDLRFLGCRIWHCTLFLLNLDHTFIFKACGETVYFLKSNIWTIGNVMLDTHTHHSNPSPTLNNIHLGRQTEEGMESVSDCAGEAQDTHTLTHSHTHTLTHTHTHTLIQGWKPQRWPANWVNAAHFNCPRCLSLRMFSEGRRKHGLWFNPHPDAWITRTTSSETTSENY